MCSGFFHFSIVNGVLQNSCFEKGAPSLIEERISSIAVKKNGTEARNLTFERKNEKQWGKSRRKILKQAVERRSQPVVNIMKPFRRGC